MSLDSITSDPVETAVSPDEATTDTSTEDTTTEAVQQDEDTSQASETETTEPEETGKTESTDNPDDTELKDWAAKKNLPLDDPLKIAKMYRESEKQLGKKGQQEGQLKAAVTGANESAGVDDVQALRNEVTALSFYIQHPEAKQYESEMVSILEDKPWLANDLEVVLDAAKGRSTTNAEQLVAERQAGKKEALAAAEKAGRAAPPQASAKSADNASNQKITIDNVDDLIARNGQDWFVKNRDKINRVLAGN